MCAIQEQRLATDRSRINTVVKGSVGNYRGAKCGDRWILWSAEESFIDAHILENVRSGTRHVDSYVSLNIPRENKSVENGLRSIFFAATSLRFCNILLNKKIMLNSREYFLVTFITCSNVWMFNPYLATLFFAVSMASPSFVKLSCGFYCLALTIYYRLYINFTYQSKANTF